MGTHAAADNPRFYGNRLRMSRRSVLKVGVALGGGLAFGGALRPGAASAATTEPVKTASTFYTSAKVAAARHNVATYDWAKSTLAAAQKIADQFVAQSDEWLWSLVTPQSLPRSINVNYLLGSLTTGKDVYQLGYYPFTMDPWNRPWKIVDPLAAQRGLPSVFPTNDFGAFYESAIDANGIFDRTKGDRSFLVNTLYPEKGPDWGVDDGYGYVDPAGNHWTFIAYYTHFSRWSGVGSIEQGIQALRDSYLYTGDVKYAHAGIIMLDRIADFYPAMDCGAFPRSYGFRNSDPGTGKGKIVGSIWEPGLISEFIKAYDAFFPALAKSDQANVVPFLNSKASQYGHPPKNDVAAIRLNAENGLLRPILPAVQAAQIYGNFGFHQSALAMAAAVLDYPAEAGAWFDFTFATGKLESQPTWHVTGGDVYRMLIDDIDRDGWSDEASPFYDTQSFNALKTIADVLDGYAGYPGADLYQHPKFRRMFTGGPRIVALDAYIPSIGDAGATGQPGIGFTADTYVTGFERYGDPSMAQLAYLLNKNSTVGLNSGIFSADPAGTEDKIRTLITTDGPLDRPTENMTGYGLGWLRSGAVGTPARREAWIYYGRTTTDHSALEALHLGLYGFGLDLLPDQGYPEATDYSNFSQEWTHNTISHNTVVVDKHPQKGAWVAQPQGFASGQRVQFADIAAPASYPQTSSYRRATAMIDVDGGTSYLVDVFRVVGGQDHVFSFHAGEGPATAGGLQLVAQPTGTYAGAGVPMPARRAAPTDWTSPGFNWLDQVERDADPPPQFSVDWAVKDTWHVDNPDPNAHLRITVLGQADDVAMANGYPPQNNPGNPRSLRYLLLHRTSAASQFVSVIEPYSGTRVVKSIESVGVTTIHGTVAAHEVSAVKVSLPGGRVDYVVSCARPDAKLLIDRRFVFSGSFGMLTLKHERPEYAFGHDATEVGPLHTHAANVVGAVASFTRELSATNELVLAVSRPVNDPASLIGATVYVDNDGQRNAAYLISAAAMDGHRKLVLGLADQTTVRGYVDDTDFSKGYTYDLAIGATARIPLTAEWTR